MQWARRSGVVAMLAALGLASGRGVRAQAPGAASPAGSAVERGASSSDTTWAAWRLVLGDWVAETGGGVPGAASAGGDSYRPDLDGRVLVRRYWSEYPATATRPVFRDEGLMIVYAEGGGWRAIAFDNEGHVIRYVAAASDTVVTLVSEVVAGAPRFRLSYRPAGADRLSIRFELAPPGQPDAFRTYVEGRVRRR